MADGKGWYGKAGKKEGGEGEKKKPEGTHERHARERGETHQRHSKARDDMNKQHEMELAQMAERHAAEAEAEPQGGQPSPPGTAPTPGAGAAPGTPPAVSGAAQAA